MANYHIKEIEQLSGIKAHTLRIWEKRYGIIEPKRTKTNIRYYTDEDLKKVLNISLLNKSGYKISKIAKLPNARLNNEVLNLSSKSETYEIQIASLIKSMIDFDEFVFEKTFNKSIMQIGFEDTILKVVYPFFTRIGVLWLTDNIDPAQEHFISNLLRQKIITAVDSIPEYPNSNSANFVLFLQEDQWHEMGLILSSYLIKKSGHRSIYLGTSLPNESVKRLSNILSFEYIVTTVNYTLSHQEIIDSIMEFSREFSDKKIFYGGVVSAAQPQPIPSNVTFINNLVEFDSFLKNINKS